MRARARPTHRLAAVLTPLARAGATRLWAAPASLLGLALGLPCLALGGRATLLRGVLEVAAPAWSSRGRRGARLLDALGFDAITFGHVVLARSAAAHEALRLHERVHVRQYEAWGALFLVAYPAESLLQWVRGRRAYLDNRFEVEARRLSEREDDLVAQAPARPLGPPAPAPAAARRVCWPP